MTEGIVPASVQFSGPGLIALNDAAYQNQVTVELGPTDHPAMTGLSKIEQILEYLRVLYR